MRGAFPTGWRPESLARSVPPAFAGREDPPRTPPRRRFAPRRRTRDFLHSRLTAGGQSAPHGNPSPKRWGTRSSGRMRGAFPTGWRPGSLARPVPPAFRGEGGPSPHPSPAALRAASAREGLSPQPASRSAGAGAGRPLRKTADESRPDAGRRRRARPAPVSRPGGPGVGGWIGNRRNPTVRTARSGQQGRDRTVGHDAPTRSRPDRTAPSAGRPGREAPRSKRVHRPPRGPAAPRRTGLRVRDPHRRVPGTGRGGRLAPVHRFADGASAPPLRVPAPSRVRSGTRR